MRILKFDKFFEDIDEMSEEDVFMQQTIELAKENIRNGGGPFACLIVKNGKVVGQGANSVTKNNDPTAHAEVQAIRDACSNLGTFQLDGCEVYASCEPCPMCLGAIYWARPDIVYYGATKIDAANVDFDDAYIYKEIARPPMSRNIPFVNNNRENALEVFKLWDKSGDKIPY